MIKSSLKDDKIAPPHRPPYLYQQDPKISLKLASNLHFNEYINSLIISKGYNTNRSDVRARTQELQRKTTEPISFNRICLKKFEPFIPSSGFDQPHVIPTGKQLGGELPDEKYKRDFRERYYDKMMNEDIPMRPGMNYPYYRAYLDSLPESNRHPSYYDSNVQMEK